MIFDNSDQFNISRSLLQADCAWQPSNPSLSALPLSCMAAYLGMFRKACAPSAPYARRAEVKSKPPCTVLRSAA